MLLFGWKTRWLGVTGELCVLYQLAGLYQAPAHSMAGGTIPAGASKNRMAALLALAASAQYVLVAFAAYCAAVLYRRPVGGSPTDRQHDDYATLPVPSHPLQPSVLAKHLMPKRLAAMPIDAAPASFADRTSPHTTRAPSRSLNYQPWQ